MKKKFPEPIVMPMPCALHKNPAPSPLPTATPNKDAPHVCGNTPPPPVIAVPAPELTASHHLANPWNALDVLGLLWSKLKMVLQNGILGIAPGSLPIFMHELHSKGVVPLERVTYRALQDPDMLDAICACSDYPKWDHCVHLYALLNESKCRKVAEQNLKLLFSHTPACRDNPKLLTEILSCILLSCESTPSTVQFGCAIFCQLWMWLHRTGIGGDDGLALLEASDLNFPLSDYPVRQSQLCGLL